MDDLRSIDLNLLVILEALLDEAHVTRAAARLRLSQPATSGALDRLRHLFGDRLLERRSGGMRPTPRAEALRPALRTILGSVRMLVNGPEVELATVRQTVRLLMADALAAMLLPDLLAHLADSAPGVRLVLLPWHGGTRAVDRLAAGDVELVVSVLPPLGTAFHKVALFEERYRIAMRRDHPAAVAGLATGSVDVPSWLAHRHVVVSGEGSIATPLDGMLEAAGLSRQVGVVVPSFLLVPPLLLRSDLVALMPGRCIPDGGIPDGGAGALAGFAPPMAIPGFRLDMAWHERRHGDRVVRHVADEMLDLTAPMRPAER